MELTQIKPFSSDDLHMNTSGMNMRAVAAVVELTLEKPSNQYSLLFSSLESSKIELLPVRDYESARKLFNVKLANLERNSSLMLSHIACHGVILGHFTPNGKLMAHTQDTPSQDVQVQSFDELRSHQLSPVIDTDVFSLIKQGWGAGDAAGTMERINSIADQVGMDTQQFGHAYVRFMTGLLDPKDVSYKGLDNAAREMSVLIAKNDSKTLEVLWSQIEKTTGLVVPLLDWKPSIEQPHEQSAKPLSEVVAPESKNPQRYVAKIGSSPSF